MMFNPHFNDQGRFAPDAHYTSSRTEGQSTATTEVRDGKVRIRLNAPGFDPAETSVRIRSTALDRILVLEASDSSVVGTSTRSITLRLPAHVGTLASPARFRNGVVTLDFEHTPAGNTDESVEVQK